MKRYYAVIAVSILLLVSAFTFRALNKDEPTQSVQPKLAEPIKVTGTAKVNPPTPDELLLAFNNERIKTGVSSVKLDPKLNISAQLKSNDMYQNKYFGHENPVTGKRGYTYVIDVGVKCIEQGENITQNIGINDTASTMRAWMNSKPHREAIQNPKFETVGFGIADNYITAHFCDVN